tara:strand:+ start:52153 stop:52536 length:384 start_codon:yes stop_codon:yes gene_type:complete
MTNAIEPRGELAIRTLAMPMNTNANGDIFGGWIVSQMDLGGSILAKRLAKCRTVTVCIDKLNFQSPVHVGDTVCCYGDVQHVGRTSICIHLQVWTRDVDGETRQLVTEGDFTYVAINEKGKPQAVKR